jgi:hypothetical protein
VIALAGGSASSGNYTTTAAGTFYWVATYSGDANNDAATSGLAAAPVTLNKISITASGVTATKVYDTTDSFTNAQIDITGASWGPVLVADVGNVSLEKTGVTGAYGPDVGSGTLTLSGSFTLSGSAADNYILSQPTVAASITPATVNLAAVPGVIAPVRGATPVTTITPTAQYTGTVTWMPADSPFKASTTYTATITLTPTPNYTLAGVAADFFTAAGATSATNAADDGMISAAFPMTLAAPLSAALPVPTLNPAMLALLMLGLAGLATRRRKG